MNDCCNVIANWATVHGADVCEVCGNQNPPNTVKYAKFDIPACAPECNHGSPLVLVVIGDIEVDYKQLFIDSMEELGKLDMKSPTRLAEMWAAYDDAIYNK